MIMRKIILAALAALTLVSLASCHKYKYETVKGDPLKTKIYTLDNGHLACRPTSP